MIADDDVDVFKKLDSIVNFRLAYLSFVLTVIIFKVGRFLSLRLVSFLEVFYRFNVVQFSKVLVTICLASLQTKSYIKSAR